MNLEKTISYYLSQNHKISKMVEQEKRLQRAMEKCLDIVEVLLVLLPTVLPVIAGVCLGFFALVGKIQMISFLKFVFDDGMLGIGERILVYFVYILGCFLACLIPIALTLMVFLILGVVHNYRVRRLLSKSIIDAVADECGLLLSVQFIPGFWDRPLIGFRANILN